MILRCVLAGLVCVILLGGCSLGVSFEPGYADLDYPEIWEAEAEESFSIGPGLLSLARWAISLDDQLDDGEHELLQNLRSVRVKTYSLKEGAAANISERIARTRAALLRKGWTNIVSVREEQSHSAILVRLGGERIQGLVILHSDAEEAVFFNVVGDISVQNLTQISRKHLHGESVLAGLTSAHL